jgi:hypothetical protein
MTSLEDRLERVEAQLDRLAPSLDERVERLEQAAKSATASSAANAAGLSSASAGGRAVAAGKRFVGWMGAELPKFLAAAVLLVFGWGIKDSVDLSIKQRQLDLSYTKEMQALLQQMSKRDADWGQLESTAVVLASYGEAALPPLLSELRYTGLRADAAAAGIASLALHNPEPVCEALPRVLANRGQQYVWDAHLKVVRLLGETECVAAVPALQGYRQVVAAATQGDAARFEELVRTPPLAPAEDYKRLLDAIDRSLRLLAR